MVILELWQFKTHPKHQKRYCDFIAPLLKEFVAIFFSDIFAYLALVFTYRKWICFCSFWWLQFYFNILHGFLLMLQLIYFFIMEYVFGHNNLNSNRHYQDLTRIWQESLVLEQTVNSSYKANQKPIILHFQIYLVSKSVTELPMHNCTSFI